MTNNTDNPGGATRVASRKRLVRTFLEQRDRSGIEAWAAQTTNPFRTLYSSLWETAPLLCWRAAEALGWLAEKPSQRSQQKIIETVRRLFWAMNDESGNLCWYAGQAVGEILYRATALREEFLDNYLSFLIEEPFEVGVRHGVIRLAGADDLAGGHRKRLIERAPVLIGALNDSSAAIRGYSVLALRTMDLDIPGPEVDRLRGDQEAFDFYDVSSGELRSIRSADILQ